MQAYLIVLIVIMSIVLLAINIYLLILYIHPDDKGIGTAWYCKVLVIIGLTICQAQALMVPLDVANRSAVLNTAMDMRAFWFFLYIIVLVFITVLIPYAIFLYETDQEDPICSRMLKALAYLAGAVIISVLILFISWGAGLKYIQLPYEQYVLEANQFNQATIPSPKTSESIITLETSLAVYIIAIMSFFGWIFLVIFGGVGLFALPMDLISEFKTRPKARKTKQMKKTKEKMVEAIKILMKEGQQLKELDVKTFKNEQAGWFERFKGNRKVGNKLTQFRAKYYALAQQYRVFDLELKYNDSNPVIPYLKLVLGVIFFITTILWIIQIIFGNIAKQFTGDRPLIPWFNQLLIKLQQSNAGFVGTFVFAYLCLYMLWSVQKGNIKFGIRIPCCCRFHPMKQNETWMNSFLFNVILLLISSVGVIQLCIGSFPTYTRNTEIYMIFGVQINYMRFYTAFYRYNVFPIALIIWSFLTLIYQIITCNKKPPYMKEIQTIRKQEAQDLQRLRN